MTSTQLLAGVDPSWFADVAPELCAQALRAPRARRWLLRGLDAPAPNLLAPSRRSNAYDVVAAWPRARLAAVRRQLGALAYAPAIRTVVQRDPVQRLKKLLEGDYRLALDDGLWDARIDAELSARLWQALVGALHDDTELSTLLHRQGQAELCAWALPRDRALAEWATLTEPRASDEARAHLPEAVATAIIDPRAAPPVDARRGRGRA